MSETEQKPINKITFHWIKSSCFRVVHVDGVVGAIAPNKLVHASVFSERHAIPIQEDWSLKPDKTLGERVSYVSRGGVVRELEADLVMAPEVARQFARWLIERANEAEGKSNG